MATYTGTRKPCSRRQAVVAIGAVLAIGAAAGLGSWRIGLHEHSRGRTTTATQAQIQVQPPTGSRASTLPSVATASAAARRDSVLYLVSSDAEAAQLRAGIGFISDPTVAPDVTIAVLPPDSQTSADEMSFLLSAENESRRLRGLQAVQVVDLRTSPPPPAAQPPSAPTRTLPAASVVPPQETIALVASQAEADGLNQALGVENARRLQFGEPLLREQVVVVTSLEEEAMLRSSAATVADAAPDHRPVTVVDLRSPAPGASSQ